MATRRGVLKLVGGGVVLAAVAAGAGYAGWEAWASGRQASSAARDAWTTAGKTQERRHRFLSYALLAPNPHNRQPWIVRLEGEDGLTLWCDLDRRLPATDPNDRQILIGCAAFLEFLSIAAASEGFGAEISPFPEGPPEGTRLDAKPIARAKFIEGAVPREPLFDSIIARVTNRNVYDAYTPSDEELARLMVAGSYNGAQCRATSDPAQTAKLRDLVWKAFERETKTSAANNETVALTRIGKADVERNRDGISLEGPGIEAMQAVGLLSAKTLADQTSIAFGQELDLYKKKAMSSKAFAWITTEDNDRLNQMAAGSAYARFSLKAAELGLAVHPWSQSLQEYPEQAEFYKQAQAMLGDGGVVQMLVRVGHAAPVPHAPRRGLDALVKI